MQLSRWISDAETAAMTCKSLRPGGSQSSCSPLLDQTLCDWLGSLPNSIFECISSLTSPSSKCCQVDLLVPEPILKPSLSHRWLVAWLFPSLCLRKGNVGSSHEVPQMCAQILDAAAGGKYPPWLQIASPPGCQLPRAQERCYPLQEVWSFRFKLWIILGCSVTGSHVESRRAIVYPIE